MVVVGIIAVLVLGAILDVWFSWRRDMYKVSKSKKSLNYTPKPFSVSDYYKRKEKFLLDLEMERQNQEEYLITLYFGNDGLQLKKDGTFEWIKRREVKKEQPPKPYSFANTFNPVNTQCQNTIDAMDALLAANVNLSAIDAQLWQTRNMINSLQSMTNHVPCYPSTYQYAPWSNYGGCGSGVPTVILDSGCAYANIGG